MYIKRVKNLEENSKIGKEIISSLRDAILQEAKKKKKRKQSALSPFCYLDREEKKKEPEVKTDAGNVEQGIEFFNSTFNSNENSAESACNGVSVSTGVSESMRKQKTSKTFYHLLDSLREVAEMENCKDAIREIDHVKKYGLNESILNEIYPNKGEKKGEFISRFMSDKNMKKEYPDNKQRLAVAYSYYDRKDEKMELSENLFEETNEAKPLSSIFDTEDKPIIVLVDDARKYDSEWFNREFEKEDLEEDFDETVFQEQKKKREDDKKREKYAVSDKEVQKVLDNIANSYIKVLPTAKNNDFAKKYNLSNNDQIDIVKKLVKSNYQYSTKSDNTFYEGNVLTVFADNLSVKDNPSESVKMYIKVDDTIAGKVMVVSLHKDSDFRDNKRKESENENMRIKKVENLSEANYGGAFDIADDQFFTREDIDDFSYELVEILKEDFDNVEYISSYLENNEFEITLSWNDWEETVTIPIDMRKIRKPSDLQDKYMMKFVDVFANKFAENEQTESESLNEEKEQTLTDFINSRDFHTVLVSDVNNFNLKEFENSVKEDDEIEDDNSYHESLLENDNQASSEHFTVSKEDVQNLIEKISKSDFFVADYYKTRGLMKNKNLSEDDIKSIVKQLNIGDYSYSTKSKSFKPGDVISVFITNRDFEVNEKNLSGLTLYIELDLDYGDIAAIVSVHQQYKHNKKYPKDNPYSENN